MVHSVVLREGERKRNIYIYIYMYNMSIGEGIFLLRRSLRLFLSPRLPIVYIMIYARKNVIIFLGRKISRIFYYIILYKFITHSHVYSVYSQLNLC